MRSTVWTVYYVVVLHNNVIFSNLTHDVQVTAEHVFDITNLADTEDYLVYGHTPLLNLQPVDVNKELDIYAALQKARRT